MIISGSKLPISFFSISGQRVAWISILLAATFSNIFIFGKQAAHSYTFYLLWKYTEFYNARTPHPLTNFGQRNARVIFVYRSYRIYLCIHVYGLNFRIEVHPGLSRVRALCEVFHFSKELFNTFFFVMHSNSVLKNNNIRTVDSDSFTSHRTLIELWVLLNFPFCSMALNSTGKFDIW